MNAIHESWFAHCGGQYPREFGHPVRITSPIRNDAQLISTIERWQSKGHPAYVTVYSFDDWKHRPGSAIMDRIFVDLDHATNPQIAIDEGIRLIENLNKHHDIQTTQYFSGKKGLAVYIDFDAVQIADDNKKEVIAMFQNILKKLYDLTTMDMHVVGDINRISRLPNTMHQSSGLYCIPITLDEMRLGIDEIISMARSPRTDLPVVRQQNGGVRQHLLDYERATVMKHEFDQATAWMHRARMPDMTGNNSREQNIANKLIRLLEDGTIEHGQRVGLVHLLHELGHSEAEIVDVFMTASAGGDRDKTTKQVSSIIKT